MKTDLKWQERAACRAIIHFQDDPKETEHGWTIKQRKNLCLTRCEVRFQCLEYAMTFPLIEVSHRNLVSGGLTGLEVAALIRKRDKAG